MHHHLAITRQVDVQFSAVGAKRNRALEGSERVFDAETSTPTMSDKLHEAPA
jgi:hypothetical protein